MQQAQDNLHKVLFKGWTHQSNVSKVFSLLSRDQNPLVIFLVGGGHIAYCPATQLCKSCKVLSI